MKKRWPTTEDLIAWHLFWWVDEVPEKDFNPDTLKAEMERLKKVHPLELHKKAFQNDCKEFHEQFKRPEEK